MFYERLAGNEEYTMGPNPPFSYSGSASNVLFSNPAAGWSGASSTASPVLPASYQGIANPYKTPTAIQYSLGIQHQLREGTVLNVGYVGNQNHHQSLGFPINTVGMNNPNRQAICGSTCGWTGDKYNPDLDRPYRGWSSVSLMQMDGNSNYIYPKDKRL